MIFTLLIFLSSLSRSLTCRFHEQNFSDVEKVSVQAFKKKLLKELGFCSVPNVNKIKAPKVPSFYKRLIEEENSKPIQTSELDEDDFLAKTNQLFLFPEQVVSVTGGTERNLIFKWNPIHPTLEIVSALLWIHIVHAPISVENPDLRKGDELQLYKSYRASGTESKKEHFHSEHLKATGWYKVEVSGMIQGWFSEQPKIDLSLDVAVEGARSLEIGGVSDDGEPLQPFLAINTKEKRGRINRNKRKAVSKECPGTPTSTCCLQQLTIDFEKLNWDFIIAPRILNFAVCSGDCSLNIKGNINFFSNQARAAPFAGKLNPRKQKNISCCVPKTTNDITLLLFDESGDVRILTLRDARALSCHCVV